MGRRATEADRDQPSPAGVDQHAFSSQNQEEPEQKAAADVDEERAIRKGRSESLANVAAKKITGASPHDRTQCNPDVGHDGVLQAGLLGVISPAGG